MSVRQGVVRWLHAFRMLFLFPVQHWHRVFNHGGIIWRKPDYLSGVDIAGPLQLVVLNLN